MTGVALEHDLDQRVFLSFLKQLSNNLLQQSDHGQLATAYFDNNAHGLDVVHAYAELISEMIKCNYSLEDLQRKLESLNLKEQHVQTILVFWKTEAANILDVIDKKSNWSQALSSVHWRTNVKVASSDSREESEPCAILSLELQNSITKDFENLNIEVSPEEVSELLKELDKIQAKLQSK